MIEQWYALNAPSAAFSVRSGARVNRVLEIESSLHLRLPSDVVESYRLHDGSADGLLPYGDALLSLDELLTTWHRMCESADGAFRGIETEPQGPIKPVWWNRKWIPIVSSGSGDYHCVDLDQEVGGRVGQFFLFYHEGGPDRVVSPSFGDWLADLAEGLRNGRYRYDEESLTLLPLADD